jgi:hypothetical protein
MQRVVPPMYTAQCTLSFADHTEKLNVVHPLLIQSIVVLPTMDFINLVKTVD